MSRVPRASARRALCLRFLLASFVLVAVCPPVGLGRIGLVCPYRALSRKLVRWRGASRSPLRGCLRALPPPLPLFWSVVWAALPVGRLRRRALMRSSLGTAVCPFGAVFVPLSRGWLVFLPSVPLPRPRFAAVAPLGSRWEPALPRAALGVRPLSPHLGGSAPPLGCPLYLSLRFLAPSGRCAVTRLRFVAPSDDTFSCLRLWLLLSCPLRGSAASRCPVGLFVCMRVSLRSPRA